VKLKCTGPGFAADCQREPRYATWCECPVNEEGGTLAGALFFFCAWCLQLDLERDPTDEVLVLEELGPEIRLRPIARCIVHVYGLGDPACEVCGWVRARGQ